MFSVGEEEGKMDGFLDIVGGGVIWVVVMENGW